MILSRSDPNTITKKYCNYRAKALPESDKHKLGRNAAHFVWIARCVGAHDEYLCGNKAWLNLFVSSFYILSKPNYLDIAEMEERSVFMKNCLQLDEFMTELPDN